MKYWSKIFLVVAFVFSSLIPLEIISKEGDKYLFLGDSLSKEEIEIIDPAVNVKKFTVETYQTFLNKNDRGQTYQFRKLDKKKKNDIISILNDKKALVQLFDAATSGKTQVLDIHGKKVTIKYSTPYSNLPVSIRGSSQVRTISASVVAEIWGFSLFRLYIYCEYEYSGTTVKRVLDTYTKIVDSTPISWTSSSNGWVSGNKAYGRGKFHAKFSPVWYVDLEKTAIFTVWGGSKGHLGSSFSK